MPQQSHFRKTHALILLSVSLPLLCKSLIQGRRNLKKKQNNTTFLHATHNENITEQALYPFCCSIQSSCFYQKKPYFIIIFSFCKRSVPQDSQSSFISSCREGRSNPPKQLETSSLQLKTALGFWRCIHHVLWRWPGEQKWEEGCPFPSRTLPSPVLPSEDWFQIPFPSSPKSRPG